VDELFQLWQKQKLVTKAFYPGICYATGKCDTGIKFSTDRNDLCASRPFAWCRRPRSSTTWGWMTRDEAAMTVDRMGKWRLIVEGANTYSPDPNKKAQRTQLEQILYREKGVMIANDYLVNSGGVIFAAQEYHLPTPAHLQIQTERLGNPQLRCRSGWMSMRDEFEELSQKRKESGEKWREKVISANMIELVDHLANDPNLLPCQAAERISLSRLKAREEGRLAKDIMIDIPLVSSGAPLQEVAAKIVEHSNNMAAVIDEDQDMVGVITAWDVTQAVAQKHQCGDMEVDQVMTARVVTAGPGDSLPVILRKLEENQISAMPVVEEGKVLGLVNSDVLAYSFLKLHLT
jgi:CBS domain-containing protein